MPKLWDLPDVALQITASYLHKASCALLCVAMGNSRKTAGACRSILSLNDVGRWSSLDFGDLDRRLALRLTDEHVRSILTCIDAANKLKSLKMTGCNSILGHGLEPLSTSTVIQRLDLAIVRKREEPLRLREDMILPVILNIMQSNSSLEVVQLPIDWENGYASETACKFALVYKQYKSLIRSRGRKCKECEEEGQFEEVCYSCLGMFHGVCPRMRSASFAEMGSNVNTDGNCMRQYCHACLESNEFSCSWCEEDQWCRECAPMTWKCNKCGDRACRSCAFLHFKRCAICHKLSCTSCVYFEASRSINTGAYVDICEDCLGSKEMKERYRKSS